MYIGKRLESLRKAKKMSLTEISRQSGVQLATLSRIENMKMVGTLESHINIAKALGVDVTELYKDLEKESTPVDMSSPKTRTDVFAHSEHSSYEILTKNVLQKKLMPVLLRIDCGGRTNKEQGPAGCEKFLFVLEGTIEVNINGECFKLGKNSSLYFDAHQPHTLTNTGKATAKALAISTPVSL